jgi:hypothetical protein
VQSLVGRRRFRGQTSSRQSYQTQTEPHKSIVAGRAARFPSAPQSGKRQPDAR